MFNEYDENENRFFSRKDLEKIVYTCSKKEQHEKLLSRQDTIIDSDDCRYYFYVENENQLKDIINRFEDCELFESHGYLRILMPFEGTWIDYKHEQYDDIDDPECIKCTLNKIIEMSGKSFYLLPKDHYKFNPDQMVIEDVQYPALFHYWSAHGDHGHGVELVTHVSLTTNDLIPGNLYFY